MTDKSSVIFATLRQKLGKADADIDLLRERLKAPEQRDRSAAYAISFALLRVYNAFEDVMKTVAKEIDGKVPTDGAGWHQQLIDQMSADVPDIRPPLLFGDTLKHVSNLKDFRHKANHDYGMAMDFGRLKENAIGALAARDGIAAALDAVHAFLKHDDGDGGGGGMAGGPR